MTLNPNNCAIIACDVFMDELASLDPHEGKWHSITFLEMGLHDQPDLLRKEVQAKIDGLEEDGAVETILLLYGVCGNGLIGVTSRRCNLVLPRAHDCISVLLGSPSQHQALLKENPAVYFYSPGWVRGKRVPGPDREAHVRAYYKERFPDDEELLDDLVEADRETFAHHNCAAYVDVTGNQEAETYCRQCASGLGWQYPRLEGNADLLKDFLAGNWEADRFLITEPGQPVRDLVQGESVQIQG
jgi:hypothetical protein